VPQQEASHAWQSSIFYTKLADGGSLVFPFYRTSQVQARVHTGPRPLDTLCIFKQASQPTQRSCNPPNCPS